MTTTMTPVEAKAALDRIRNHCRLGSDAYKATELRSGEIPKSIVQDGTTTLVVISVAYGAEKDRGTRTVMLEDDGNAYELLDNRFTARKPHTPGTAAPNNAPRFKPRAERFPPRDVPSPLDVERVTWELFDKGQRVAIVTDAEKAMRWAELDALTVFRVGNRTVKWLDKGIRTEHAS